jgi:CheY-like chemotaxis protein
MERRDRTATRLFPPFSGDPPLEATEQEVGPRPRWVGSTHRELFLVTPTCPEHGLLDDRAGLAGWIVEVRPPTEETVDEIVKRRPPLILADDLPGDERALELVRRVHAALGTLAPHAIALVSGGSESVFERAFAAGAVDVLSYPIAPALLHVKLERHARHLALPTGRFGRFRIQRVLGRGGFGTVFLADVTHGESAGTLVALKVIPLDAIRDAPESLTRFYRESETLRSLESKRVPRFVDAGRVDDSFFCAMEFIPGENLASVLSREPLGDDATERVLDDVAATLVELHEAGLVHRDVKPSNVIVTPGGTSRLVDFGLAKCSIDPSVTRAGEVLGTVRYMAPELLRGEPASPATDAFALGVTALEAALGGSAVESSNAEFVRKRSRGVTPLASELIPRGCAALRLVLDGLLHPESGHRLPLASARVLLRDCVGRVRPR